MDKFEAYSFLLSDVIFGNMLLYAHNEFVLYAMKRLGQYNNQIMLTVSTLGFTIAVIINYSCGAILLKLYKASIDNEKLANYRKLYRGFQQYGYYILCTNIFPLFGSFIPLLTGFADFGLWRCIIVAVTSKMIFYLYYIYL